MGILLIHLFVLLWDSRRRRRGRFRHIRHIRNLHIEDEILERFVAGSGRLVICQESGDIQSSLTALPELPEAVIPALYDLSLSDNEFIRFFAGSFHIGFEFLSGRQ